MISNIDLIHKSNRSYVLVFIEVFSGNDPICRFYTYINDPEYPT